MKTNFDLTRYTREVKPVTTHYVRRADNSMLVKRLIDTVYLVQCMALSPLLS